MSDRTVVYTDGACLGNPGPGGWAWAVPEGPYRSGAEPSTTNQRMEITAVLEAVRHLAGPLDVVSDSAYVVNCWRDRWWEAWLRNGWRNSQRRPVANRDLWEPLVAEFQTGRIRMRWVKGHGTDPMNDLVDRLALEAATTQRGRSGVGTPAVGVPDLQGRSPARHPGESAPLRPPPAPADAPARWAVPTIDPHADRLPGGHRLVVGGLRPTALGGYERDNPVAVTVRRRLAELLAALRESHPDLVVLTGLGLGAEQLAAEAANEVGVPYVAVLAYPAQDGPWPLEAKRRYARLLANAATTLTLDPEPPASRQRAGAALRRRDAWLARHADEAVVVWDGRDDGVGRLVRLLRDELGEDNVRVIEPPGD